MALIDKGQILPTRLSTIWREVGSMYDKMTGDSSAADKVKKGFLYRNYFVNRAAFPFCVMLTALALLSWSIVSYASLHPTQFQSRYEIHEQTNKDYEGTVNLCWYTAWDKQHRFYLNGYNCDVLTIKRRFRPDLMTSHAVVHCPDNDMVYDDNQESFVDRGRVYTVKPYSWVKQRFFILERDSDD